MDINLKNIGNKLKEIRKRERYTQENIAEFADISKSHYSHIEKGTTKPSLNTLIRIVNVLNVSMDEVLDIELNKKSLYITLEEIDKIFRNCNMKQRNLLINNMIYLQNNKFPQCIIEEIQNSRKPKWHNR